MEQILSDIRHIIEEARNRVARSINHEKTLAYWHIGERIVVEEQGGNHKADYGKYLLKNLSEVLVTEYGDGFSTRQLELMRQFYLTFPIANTVYSQLTWSHYKVLIRIDDGDKRTFYIAESIKNAWAVRQMERQIHSLLYERLLIRQDKEAILAIAKGEQQPFEASQIIINNAFTRLFFSLQIQFLSRHNGLMQRLIAGRFADCFEMPIAFFFVQFAHNHRNIAFIFCIRSHVKFGKSVHNPLVTAFV